MRHRSRSLAALSALGIRPDPEPIPSFSPFHSLAPSNAFVYHLYSALPALFRNDIRDKARDSTTNKFYCKLLPEPEQR